MNLSYFDCYIIGNKNTEHKIFFDTVLYIYLTEVCSLLSHLKRQQDLAPTSHNANTGHPIFFVTSTQTKETLDTEPKLMQSIKTAT